MGAIQPPSQSNPGSVTLQPVNLHPPNLFYPQWTAMAWDAPRSRRHLISRVVSACRTRPRWIEGIPALEQVEFAHRCSLAVVALGACPSPDDMGLQNIRSLKRKGFKVMPPKGASSSS